MTFKFRALTARLGAKASENEIMKVNPRCGSDSEAGIYIVE